MHLEMKHLSLQTFSPVFSLRAPERCLSQNMAPKFQQVATLCFCVHTILARLWAGVCVSLSVDPKPQEKRRPPHHRSILRSPSNSHAPSRPPLSPPSSSSSSSSSVCAAGTCPLPASVSMTGLYSLQSPSLSTLLPSLQALPRPGLLSKLSPLLLQGLPPATSAPAGPTQDWIWTSLWEVGLSCVCVCVWNRVGASS